MISFAGWVPNITGQLSFSLIGLRGGIPNCVTANCELPPSAAKTPHRVVLVAQKRVTRDIPLLFRLGFPAREKHYLLVGKTSAAIRPVLEGRRVKASSDEIGMLAGRVLVIPYHRNETHRREAAIMVRKARSLMGGATQQCSDPEKLKADVDRLIEVVRGVGVRVLEVDFELYRTGELRLNVNPSLYEEMDVVEPLARQVFYFIKDISHRHYHHRRSSDNLLPLTSFTGGDDGTWRRNTLWALSRTVLEARRRDRLDGYKSAIGVLAYAEAFQGLLGRVERNSAKGFALISDPAPYDFTSTRASLEAKIGEHEHRHNGHVAFWGLWITTLIATAALWISAIQIQSSACRSLHEDEANCAQPRAFFAWLVKQLIVSPEYIYGVLLIVALIYLGGRYMNLPPVAMLFGEIEAWSQALGATVSRSVASWWPEGNDRIGAVVAALCAFLIGGGLVALLGYFVLR